jgi:hypothetical protein
MGCDDQAAVQSDFITIQSGGAEPNWWLGIRISERTWTPELLERHVLSVLYSDVITRVRRLQL